MLTIQYDWNTPQARGYFYGFKAKIADAKTEEHKACKDHIAYMYTAFPRFPKTRFSQEM